MTVSLIKTSPKELAKVGHWLGLLHLTMDCEQQQTDRDNYKKTILKKKKQTGPYTVQRALYPEAGSNVGRCHLIVLHPPGGLVEGDILKLEVECRSDSKTLITTPSAGKVYQCEKSNAGQTQKFIVHAGAQLEWFPQEMILYDQSLSVLKTEVNLFDDAQFCGWEIVCLGREIANDYFQSGRVIQTIELRRNTKPILIERLLIDEMSFEQQCSIRSQSWGLAKKSVSGTFFMTGVNKEQFARAQAEINSFEDESIYVGITLLEDVLVCRGLSNQSRHLKKIFTKIWSLLRKETLGAEAHEPRIWST